MKINIETIPVESMRYTTLGDWTAKGDTVNIKISQMSDWRYEIAVLAHEMTEYFICKHMGITTKICDEWDDYYEEQYRLGKIPKSKEAGDDPRCPYFKGHSWGNKIERITIKLLGCSWKKYLNECNLLMGVEIKPKKIQGGCI